jgi:hypothetical protein
MSALTALFRFTDFAGLVPARGTYGVKANVYPKKGGMIALDSAGRAMPAGALAGGSVRVVGKSSATIDNRTGSELGGAADAAQLEVEFGVFGWDNSADADAIANDDAGKPCYAVDDHTVALTSQSGTLPYAGIIEEVRDGQVYVWQGPHVAAIAEAVALAGAGVALQKRTVTVGHADLTDADTSEDENIGAALPDNARILGVAIKLATPFAGITGPVTVDIGSAGDIDALIDGANLTDAAVDGQASTRPLGIAPNKHFASATQLVARFLSASGNLADANAGSVTIDVYFAVLA